MRSNIQVPLPKGWPRTIRSAVIHAISLAQFSLTHTRSWAANNWNARIRLKQENDRIRHEVPWAAPYPVGPAGAHSVSNPVRNVGFCAK